MEHDATDSTSPASLPARIIRDELPPGGLGVVMGRAGVGKTACLVQIALDHLLRGQQVLHISLHHGVEHVQSWYDALLDDVLQQVDPAARAQTSTQVGSHRMISVFADGELSIHRLRDTAQLLAENASFSPEAIVVVGYDWKSRPGHSAREALAAFKDYAATVGAQLWMTARTHREVTGNDPADVPPPCGDLADLTDLVLFMQPRGAEVTLQHLKGLEGPREEHLRLDPHTLRLVSESEKRSSVRLPASAHTLLSGGARGAEAEFGACAERWGLTEQTFTFAGRVPERKRGLVLLDDQELAQGAVSAVYLKSTLHRTFPEDSNLDKVLQSIWHQVNTAGGVFAIGQIQNDKTVKGGTGWAVELARHLHKPVTVYDQGRNGWFTWRDKNWTPDPSPQITTRRFCGTGTRSLTDKGRAAIQALFERSFGPSGS